MLDVFGTPVPNFEKKEKFFRTPEINITKLFMKESWSACVGRIFSSENDSKSGRDCPLGLKLISDHVQHSS